MSWPPSDRSEPGAAAAICRVPGTDRLLDHIQALRYRVYIEEQKKALAAADHARRRLGDGLDTTAIHFVTMKGSAISTCGHVNVLPLTHALVHQAGLHGLGALGITELAYVSKLVLAPESRTHMATAARMMVSMILWGIAEGLEVGFCHCNAALAGMYERLGLVRLRHSWMDPELGAQVLMAVFADQTAHLRRYSRQRELPEPSPQARGRCVEARQILGLAG